MRLARIVPILLATMLSAGAGSAVTIQIDYVDSAGEGFFDPTLGDSRRAALEYALSLWAEELNGSVILNVEAGFSSLGGDSIFATLAHGGPTQVAVNFSGAPLADTLYPIALANQLAGSDLLPGAADIALEYNDDVDGAALGGIDFYYGLDASPGSDVDFVSVTLHEMAHGLGYFHSINPNNGEFGWTYPDVMSRFLTEPGVGDIDTMSDAQRYDAIRSDNLFFSGAEVDTAFGGPGRMFAPHVFQGGSSVSHWDDGYSPDLLMEPAYTGAHHDIDRCRAFLLDIGWPMAPNAEPVAQNDTVQLDEDGSIDIDALSNDMDADTSDTLTLIDAGGVSNGTLSILGNEARYTPTANFHGSDAFDYTISDGRGGWATASVSITVNSVNDPPVAQDDSISLIRGAEATVFVLSNDSDDDGDDLDVSDLTPPARGSVVVNADKSISYTAPTHYTGDDSFAYTISDGQGGTDTAAVNVTVNDAPALSFAADAFVRETDGATTLTVLLSDAPAGTVEAQFVTQDDTATDTQDYQSASGILTFDALNLERTIVITIHNDDAEELRESFDVLLQSPSGAWISDDRATVTIVDDDLKTGASVWRQFR